MRIILLGGTGAMGSHLGKILTSMGHNVVVTSRSPNKSNGLIVYRKGNAKNMDFLRKILSEKYDVVVDFMLYTEKEFQMRLDLFLMNTSQYVFLSSARVYDDSNKYIVEESSRLLDSSLDFEFLSTNEYSLEKARQEDMLQKSKKKNWTIVRPYITYSETRFQLGALEKEEWLYRAMKGRSILVSEQIMSRITTLTYGLDVANGIANLIDNKGAVGETYQITSNCACEWRKILEVYLDILEDKTGRRPKVIFQNLVDYQLWNQRKYQIIYDRLYDREFDNAKINKIFDTKDFLDVEEGVRKCLEMFLENPHFDMINWKNEAIKDRYAKEISPLKEIEGCKSKIIYIAFRFFVNTKGSLYKLLEGMVKRV